MRAPPDPHRSRREVLRALVGGAAIPLLGGVLAGCGIDDPGQEVRAQTGRTFPEQAALQPSVRAANEFALDLFRAAAARAPANIAIAPGAIAASLAAARLGAARTTRQQFDSVLHLAGLASAPTAFATLDQLLTERVGDRSNSLRTGRIDLRSARAIWVPRGTTLDQGYLDRLATELDSGVRVIDFRAAPETARAAINGWASDATRGAVANLMPKGSVSEFTKMLSTSATQFQAPWDRQFTKAKTKPAAFMRADGGASQPPMMSLLSSGSARAGAGGAGGAMHVIELPYLGQELSLLLLVPDPGSLDDLTRSLDPARLDGAVRSLARSASEIRVPRFGFTTEVRLDDALRDLGLTDAFSDKAADFSGITRDEPLVISQAVHQTFFGIDEEGSSANAATVARQDPAGSLPERVITVDRPFLFVVRERQTGLVLVLGRVVDPTVS